MKTKNVYDLTTDELNQQVALCQGWYRNDKGIFWRGKDGCTILQISDYDPCHNAQQAFEIIDREKISIRYTFSGCSSIMTDKNQDVITEVYCESSGLIAAMRCYVKSVKGETVEV